jgi:hypothetical protein
MNQLDYYREQSVFTRPGTFAALWDTVNPTIEDMKAAITPLLFHYRGDGDYAENGIAEERVEEINLRYADDMLACINSQHPIVAGESREARHRMVGCCRDWALLLVSLARHHGFAARSRVGFSGYFMEGWWIDHTVAEIWDETAQRWRLVDAELHEPWTLSDGQAVDPLDLSREIFLPGLDAWRSVRAGTHDSSKFVVHPDIEEADLRDIPYLWHNTVQDLAALNRNEMLLWDVWGIDLDSANDQGAELLDSVASADSLEEWQQFYAREEFRVPENVISYQPHLPGEGPRTITLRQA